MSIPSQSDQEFADAYADGTPLFTVERIELARRVGEYREKAEAAARATERAKVKEEILAVVNRMRENGDTDLRTLIWGYLQ